LAAAELGILRFQAFPCISTALYGFPNEEAARTALEAVKMWLNHASNASKVFFVLIPRPSYRHL
jgi:O-acetyl-ADP-ribose deacetylase (regulator of RNase III)